MQYISEQEFIPARGKGKTNTGLEKDEDEAAIEREKAIALHKAEGEEIPDFIDPKQGDLDDESTPDELRGGHARSDFMAFNSADQLERRKDVRAMGAMHSGVAGLIKPEAGSSTINR